MNSEMKCSHCGSSQNVTEVTDTVQLCDSCLRVCHLCGDYTLNNNNVCTRCTQEMEGKEDTDM
jgi:rRNA maturation protein Nop10